MRTEERLRKLRDWTFEAVCRGREMKAPSPDMDVTKILRQEPRAYLGWTPTRPDSTGLLTADPLNVCPGILIVPERANVKDIADKRFDRYNNIQRSREMGQWLNVSVLFSVYEPGIRLPGFAEKPSVDKLVEGTEQGLFTLLNWMDDFKDRLLGEMTIPGTDLVLDESQFTYSPYEDNGMIIDKRPIYYGFVNVSFYCYAQAKPNRKIDQYLE